MKKLKKKSAAKKNRLPTQKIMETLRSETDSMMLVTDFKDASLVEKAKQMVPVCNEVHRRMIKVVRDCAEASGVKARLKTIVIFEGV
jgi:hypothetical protein